MRSTGLLFLLAMCSLLVFPVAAGAGESPVLQSEGAYYVPAYSNVYFGNREKPFQLAVTLSIRNKDMKEPILIDTVKYYDSKGTLLRAFLSKPVLVGPLESIRFVVPEKDNTGGLGAKFIVKWHAESAVNAPIVETVMIGTQMGQGISFTSRGEKIIIH